MIVVTGKGGQLASEFLEIKKNDKNWIFLSIDELDISNQNQVLNFFSNNYCDLLINCAAYTNVDKAESEHENCYNVNYQGVKNLIEGCKINKTKLIHYSTDYVFDGLNPNPLTEKDKPNPIGIYGKSKLNGEIEIIKSKLNSIIIRTSWVYSNYGKNFVKTMLNLSKKTQEISVVNDQIGSPTYALDLAKATISLIENQKYKWIKNEIFHFSNEGYCSWFDFAKEIFNITNINVRLSSISSEKFNTVAQRPKYSKLDSTKIKKYIDYKIPNWQESLFTMLKNEIK